MSRYRKIEVKMWGDTKFRGFDDPTKLLWCYLLSGPETTQVPGLVLIGEYGLCEALGWDLKPFRNRFGTLSKHRMAVADWPSRIIFLPNAVKHNAPHNANIVKGWASAISELPESPLVGFIVESILSQLILLDENYASKEKYSDLFSRCCEHTLKQFRNRFGTVPERSRIQEQEQEQISGSGEKHYVAAKAAPLVVLENGLVLHQEPQNQSQIQRRSEDRPSNALKSSTTSAEVEEVVRHYQTHHARSRPSQATRKKILERLKDGYTVKDLCDAIDGMHRLPFNLGANERGQKYLQLELCMRSSDHVDKYMAGLEEVTVRKKTEMEVMKDNVLAELRRKGIDENLKPMKGYVDAFQPRYVDYDGEMQ